MGKRKVISEPDFGNIVLPVANDVLGVAIQMLGNDRISVKCQDGYTRLCRIRGKMKRRVWIRIGDIYWRYRRNEAEWLRKKGYLTM